MEPQTRPADLGTVLQPGFWSRRHRLSGCSEALQPTPCRGDHGSRRRRVSDFRLRLDRDDGDQYLGDLNFKMPPGFTGDLRGVGYCPDAQILAASNRAGRDELLAPSCPVSSDVGTSNVAAGPGSHPFHAVGRMYLAGPFKGAPLSIVAITPALAGPYDYGVVVVRVALHIDPQTAQVFAASDTVPSIIGGIPIRMRSIQVNIDKPNFTINPTNCSPLLGRQPGDRRPGHGDRLLELLQCRQLRHAGIQAEDGDQAGRRPQGDQAVDQPGSALRPLDPGRRRQHQVALGDALEGLRDRPAPPRQHLLGERAGRETVRRADPDRQGLDADAAARPAASPARSTRSRGPAACRGWPSSSTARSTWCRGPTPTRSRAADCGQSSRSSQTRRSATSASTSSAARAGYLINTRDICAHRPAVSDQLPGAERPQAEADGQDQDEVRQEEEQARQASPPPLVGVTSLHETPAGRSPGRGLFVPRPMRVPSQGDRRY